MKRRIASFIAVVLASLVLNITAGSAQSLWSDGANQFSDRKARAVGDIVTILISESSSASRVGKADNSKTTSTKMNAGTGIFHGIASADTGYTDSFKTQGALVNSNTVSAKITTQVIEIKPNGNMVISGTQNIKQNGEEQKITVTGIVRPEDIQADNTVLSTYVANSVIRVDGKGPIAGKQRQGFLSQILNFLF